jgi:hypothetical protein
MMPAVTFATTSKRLPPADRLGMPIARETTAERRPTIQQKMAARRTPPGTGAGGAVGVGVGWVID